MLFQSITEAEFARIVDDSKKIVLAAVRRHLEPRYVDAVDDVVQETYLRAYRSLARGRFRGESALSSYLYAIARNEALRYNQRRARHDRSVVYQSEPGREIADARKSTEAVAESRVESSRLVVLLERIPQKYRDVLLLYGQNLSQQEIAERLGISPGTVKSRTSRGKEMLRKLWDRGTL